MVFLTMYLFFEKVISCDINSWPSQPVTCTVETLSARNNIRDANAQICNRITVVGVTSHNRMPVIVMYTVETGEIGMTSKYIMNQRMHAKGSKLHYNNDYFYIIIVFTGQTLPGACVNVFTPCRGKGSRMRADTHCQNSRVYRTLCSSCGTRRLSD